MGKHRYKKPEAPEIRGICVLCKVNPQKTLKGGKYRALCSPCDKREFSPVRPYTVHKGDHCEKCGFIPVNPVQLDVDHIDGDHSNDLPENLQTLCANCHRLKTWQEREFHKLEHR